MAAQPFFLETLEKNLLPSSFRLLTRVQFLEVVGLRFPFAYWLFTWDWSLLLVASAFLLLLSMWLMCINHLHNLLFKIKTASIYSCQKPCWAELRDPCCLVFKDKPDLLVLHSVCWSPELLRMVPFPSLLLLPLCVEYTYMIVGVWKLHNKPWICKHLIGHWVIMKIPGPGGS